MGLRPMARDAGPAGNGVIPASGLPGERQAGAGACGRRAALLLPLLLGGCGIADTLLGRIEKPPLPGVRVPVLGGATAATVRAEAAGMPAVTLPPALSNAAWSQSGGVPSHLMGNLAGGFKPAWRAHVGAGGGYRAKLTAQPLVVDGRVFVMDSDAVVSAYALADGTRLWRTPTRAPKDRSRNVGGGIAVEGGTVFAVNGLAEAVSLDAGTGKVGWRSDLGMPARSPPTVAGGRVFVGTIDARLLALDTGTGKQVWAYQAAGANGTSVLGQPAPAVGEGVVVAGFGSGDLVAVRVESGALAWSDNLGAGGGRNSLTDLSSVAAAPVIDGGTVYAIGLGGLMVASDLRSGRRVWERDIGGGQMPWVAGDWVFVVTTDQQLVALERAAGRARWLTDLPHYDNEQKHTGSIDWSGPLLAGGRLVLAGDNGRLLFADPISGAVLGDRELPGAGSVHPVAAASTVLVLTDDGTLTAFR